MNRRGFLSFLGAAAGTAVLDPERMLWVPGAKLISIPRPRPPAFTVLFHPHGGNQYFDLFDGSLIDINTQPITFDRTAAFSGIPVEEILEQGLGVLLSVR
jgi:hypothetical protein